MPISKRILRKIFYFHALGILYGCAVANTSTQTQNPDSAETQIATLGVAQIMYGEHRFADAAKIFQKLAEAGDLIAMNKLAFMYLTGEGVSKNESEGARLLLTAAELGDVDSQNSLGMLYYYGVGVNKNNILSYMWLKISNAGQSRSDNKKLMDSKIIVRYLSFEEYQEANELVVKCQVSKLKNCEKIYYSSQGIKES